jgi:hypothetical protein
MPDRALRIHYLRLARLPGAVARLIYASGMSGEISVVVLVGAFGAIAALCAVLIPKLYRVGTDGTATPPSADT